NRVVIHALQVVARQIAHRHTAPASAHAHAAARLRDHHEAAEERSIVEIVLAAVRRRKADERGMYRRTVIALGIVLVDELPVRAHVVLDAARRLERRQTKALEPRDQWRECTGERF